MLRTILPFPLRRTDSIVPSMIQFSRLAFDTWMSLLSRPVSTLSVRPARTLCLICGSGCDICSKDIPVRTLECCSGDLADLKVKSIDVEAWSPRQKKYFEVGSCSNLGDAQARRLKIRVQDENKKKYFAHTLNNTVVAPPRMLIAFLENNLQADGSVKIPKVLQPYMGGKTEIR